MPKFLVPFLALLVSFVLPLSAAEMPSPAKAGAGQPFLATCDGGLLMSWIEPEGDALAVRFAQYRNGKWDAPRTIVKANDLLANWADFPSVIEVGGVLYSHWLRKSAKPHAYDVYVAVSRDGGALWSKPVLLHRDGTASEHGFVSMVPADGESAAIIWLDGRKMSGERGDMSLRAATLTPDGSVSGEVELDGRTCECCTTGMARTADGYVAAYRDRSPEEVRDISVVRFAGGKWSKPQLLTADGWKIAGCPVNGPQVAARGRQVAVAWFTAAKGQSQVKVARSTDGGATFGKPIRVDAGAGAGRVDIVMLDDDAALVTWIEGLGPNAHIAMRRIGRDGKAGPITRIAPISSARGAGFPRIAINAGRLYIAWTDPVAKKIRMASIAAD